ncbi:MAG: hypothetical protein H0V09_06795 [Gemmatimonadetes bacterium]|nr:hypothetical protein [Gemmatimonadota bacterium]
MSPLERRRPGHRARVGRARHTAQLAAAGAVALALLAGSPIAWIASGQGGGTQRDAPREEPSLPSARELEDLVSYAEPVASRPHAVKLESFDADTIRGVFFVDSDLPSARHVAYGKDGRGYRYVWFSRRNPLRTSLVALYQVDGRGAPDILYWREIDQERKVARAREFRGPGARTVQFEYSSSPACRRPPCEEWSEAPLQRLPAPASFFDPLRRLFAAAAEHGEAHLDRHVSSLGGRPAARAEIPRTVLTASPESS